jgi:flavin reductase (DIM6/NTAB) family NADH-FMN oxidoreductase RutF
MPVSSEAFREALRHFPAGVTIVTIRAGETVHGLTVSAFASISPEPPLIMVAIDHKHSAFPLLQQRMPSLPSTFCTRTRWSCRTALPG